MVDKYMLIKDVLEEITFMKQLFIFFILIRVGFSIKIFDIFVTICIGTVDSHGFFGGWFYKFIFDMDEEFTPISPRDEKMFYN